MKKRLLKLSIFVGVAFMCHTAAAQLNITTVDITSTKSAFVRSDIDGNFNSSTLDIGTYYSTRRGQSYHRSFVEFDIASENIPADAIVTSAKLKIIHNGTVYGSNPWVVKLVMESWGETTVKFTDQPDISTLAADESNSYTTSGSTVNLDVTNMVQRMVYGQIDNYGWSLQVDDETVSSRTGAIFYSDDYTTASLRPELEIKYYQPLKITAANIVHESAFGAADGSISFTTTNGSSTNYLYNWYDGDGNPVTGGASINNLSAGWYGVKMTGDDGILEEFYYAFIVGRECEEVTIEFDPAQEYIDNAVNVDMIAGGVDYGNLNYVDDPLLQTVRSTLFGNAISSNSFFKFRLWMPDDVLVSQADLNLVGAAHAGSNAADLRKVSSFWNENYITWNNPPSVSGVSPISMPSNSGSNDALVDMKDFWDYWQDDNTTNHGVRFQMLSFSTTGTYQQYHSPNASSSANWPTIEFKIGVNLGTFECNQIFAVMKRNLTGVLYKSVNGKLNISFDNEYVSSSNEVDYKIFHHSDPLTPSISGTSQPVLLGYGVNQRTIDVSALTSGEVYILEVVNDKKEKVYLRFQRD